MASNPLTLDRFAQGYTYEQYMAQINQGKQEFEAHYKGFSVAPGDARFFRELNQKRGPVRVLALGEDWCPDVWRGLPVIAHVAQAANLELRIFPRDANLDIMNLYLNQGKYMSIPVLAFFDGSFSPLGHWIERPAAATRWTTQVREELSSLPQEALRAELSRRRAAHEAEWRQETVRELRELLSFALARMPRA